MSHPLNGPRKCFGWCEFWDAMTMWRPVGLCQHRLADMAEYETLQNSWWFWLESWFIHSTIRRMLFNRVLVATEWTEPETETLCALTNVRMFIFIINAKRAPLYPCWDDRGYNNEREIAFSDFFFFYFFFSISSLMFLHTGDVRWLLLWQVFFFLPSFFFISYNLSRFISSVNQMF